MIPKMLLICLLGMVSAMSSRQAFENRQSILLFLLDVFFALFFFLWSAILARKLWLETK